MKWRRESKKIQKRSQTMETHPVPVVYAKDLLTGLGFFNMILLKNFHGILFISFFDFVVLYM